MTTRRLFVASILAAALGVACLDDAASPASGLAFRAPERPAADVVVGREPPRVPVRETGQAGAAAPRDSSEWTRVRQVIDGDTITVSGIGTVRLIGVDAPEKTGGYRPSEPFGDRAASFMRQLAGGKLVRLEYDGDRRDRYNRTLAYVFLEDGTLINEAIIRAGWAETYRRFEYRRKASFLEAEREARDARRGMWASRRPQGIE